MVSVALALFNPGWGIYVTFPCLLAATMEGALLGSLLPAPANRILHPIIVTALAINGAAAGFGLLTGLGYQATLQSYLTKVALSSLHWIAFHAPKYLTRVPEFSLQWEEIAVPTSETKRGPVFSLQ